MADRPIIDTAILTVPTVPSWEKSCDLTPDDVAASVHLAIHDVHMAVAGCVTRPKFHKKPMARAVFVRRHRRRGGIRVRAELDVRLSIRRQAVQQRGSQA